MFNMRHTREPADYVMCFYFIVLVLFGLLVLSSAGVGVGVDRFHDPYFFIKRQMLFGFAPGIIFFLLFSKIDFRLWRKWAGIILTLICIGLVAVFIPGIGSKLNTGAQSWLMLGNFSLQPSEFTKLGIIIFLSALLAKRGDEIKNFTQGFLPTLGVAIIPVGLVIIQPDIGTGALLCAIIFALLFFGHARSAHLFSLLLLGVACLMALIVIAPYRVARLTIFLHPNMDPQGIGYHTNQASLAIGSGGWFGLGLGHSRQKFQYLPEVHADSIFAIMAEELGFIITIGFLILFALFIIRGLVIAKNSNDPFGRLMVGGIMAWFMIQFFMNIGAMIGLLPLTGIPLPFVSHGGTALMVSMAAVGIVINVSRHTR